MTSASRRTAGAWTSAVIGRPSRSSRVTARPDPSAGRSCRSPEPVDVAVERVGPLEHDQARVAEDGPQPILELIGLDRLELDDKPAGVDRADLRAELAAEEADRDDAEPLGRFEAAGSAPGRGRRRPRTGPG